MKNKKFLFLVFLFLLFVPIKVNAIAGNVYFSCDKTNSKTGDEFDCYVRFNVTSGTLDAFQATVTTSGMDVKSISKGNNSFQGTTTQLNKIGLYNMASNGNVLVAKIRVAVTTGPGTTANITLSEMEAVDYDGQINPNNAMVSVRVLNNDTSLKSLTVNGADKNGDTYVTSQSSVQVSATPNGTGASVIAGIGSKSLNCGNNELTVTVRAESGDVEHHKFTVRRVCDTNSNLNSLSVNKGSLSPSFSQGTLNYTVNVDSGTTEITIDASAASGKANVSGTGKKNLDYGNNYFEIIVRAEDSSYQTKYRVNVIREDNRSTDATLKSLIISDANLSFDPNKTSYVVNVENSVSLVEVKATANDSKATVSGKVGKQKLQVGSNKIDITVLAENKKDKKVYTITIIRKDESGNVGDLNNDNTLSTLTVAGYDISFDPNVEKYTLKLDEMIDHLDLDAIAANEAAAVIILGNEKLSPGLNIITIEVTSEAGEVRTYKIEVILPGGEEEEASAVGIENAPTNNGNSKKTGSNVLLIGCVILAVLGASGLLLYFFVIKKKNKEEVAYSSSSTGDSKILNSESSSLLSNEPPKESIAPVIEEKKEEIKPIQASIPDIQVGDLNIDPIAATVSSFNKPVEGMDPSISIESIQKELTGSEPKEPIQAVPQVEVNPPVEQVQVERNDIPSIDISPISQPVVKETVPEVSPAPVSSLAPEVSSAPISPIPEVSSIPEVEEPKPVSISDLPEEKDDVSATQMVRSIKEVSVDNIDGM